MARLYAGILGLVAFATVVVRGLLYGGEPEWVLWSAWRHLLAFAMVGGALGWLAGWLVEDAIRSRFATAVADRRKASSSGRMPGANRS